MLLTLVCLAGLAPGIATAWYVHHREHGWLLAVLAGAGVTACLPLCLLTALVAVPGLALATGVAAGLAALGAYDQGRVWVATAWVSAAGIAFWCAGAGWSL